MSSTSAFTVATVREVMTPQPLTIRHDMSVREAAAFLSDKGLSACPVVEETGRPAGVLSRSDIVRFAGEITRESGHHFEYFQHGDLTAVREVKNAPTSSADTTKVADIMTPMVLTLPPEAAIADAVKKLLEHRVHRLFVVDPSGILIGVVTALDLLRHVRL